MLFSVGLCGVIVLHLVVLLSSESSGPINRRVLEIHTYDR